MNNEYDNIKNELIQEAPILASVPKPVTKSVPSAYFENLEDHLIGLAKITQLDTPIQDAELNAYFDNLEDTIMSKVSQSEAKVYNLNADKRTSSRSNLWKYAAAFIAGIMMVGVGINIVSTQEKIETVDVHNTEYLDYVLDNIEDFDLNTMIDQGLVTESDLSMISDIYGSNANNDEPEDLFDSDINF